MNSAPPNVDDAAPGTIISERYCVERELGAGGFATVFLCTHIELASLEVAVKVLRHAHRRRTRIIEGFRREAALLAMLKNRNTVRLIDFGLTDDDRTFIAMEYVRGTALDELIDLSGPLSVADAARVGIGVLKSLVEAHGVGVIHQDLKPANIIMVNEPGEPFAAPRVLDFGIARVLGDNDPAGQTSDEVPDTIFCTPAYAPPELLRGKPDYRTDLYSLGLVLAEMIDGAPPYDFENITASRSPHLERAPVPFGHLSMNGPLAPVIKKACAKRVRHRYASAAAMLEDLQLAYRSLTPEWRNDTCIVVDDAEVDRRPPKKKAAAATSQFVETQTWHIADSTPEGEDSGLISLEEAPRTFAQTDIVQNPLRSTAREAAIKRGLEAASGRAPEGESQLLPSSAPHPDSPLARAVQAEAAKRAAEQAGQPRLLLTPQGGEDSIAQDLEERRRDAEEHVRERARQQQESIRRAAEGPFEADGQAPAPPVPLGDSAAVSRRTRDPFADGTAPVSQAREVPLFGSRVSSSPVSWTGIVVVILAIMIPALITAWSVRKHFQNQPTQERVVPVEEGEAEEP